MVLYSLPESLEALRSKSDMKRDDMYTLDLRYSEDFSFK